MQDKFDRIVFSIGAIFLVGGLVLGNFFELNSQSLSGNNVSIAQVSKIKKSSKRKIEGSLSWNEVKLNEDLYQNDLILTDSGEGINVQYKNNIEVFIDENSLVKISLLNNVFDLEVLKGTLDVNIKGQNDKIQIRSGNNIKLLEGKNAQFSVNSDGSLLNTAIKSGQVRQQDLGVKKQPLPLKKIAKKAPMFSLEKQTFDPNVEKTFKVSNIAGKKSSIQMSTTSSFWNPQTIELGENGAVVNLPTPGQYFLKDELGHIETFKVSAYVAPVFESNERIFNIIQGEPLSIQLKGGEDIEYGVRLSGAMEKSFEQKGKIISFIPLKAGDYSIEIFPVGSENAKLVESIKVNFTSPIGLESVRVAHRLNKIGEYKFADVTILGMDKEASFKKQIAIEDGEGKIIRPTTVSKTKAVFKNLKLGQYKVVATNAKATIPLKKIEIQQKVSAEVVLYKKNQFIENPKAIKANLIWSDEKVSNYRVLVSQTKDFKVLEIDTITDKNTLAVNLKRPGSYFWKVGPVDRPEILSSNIQTLNVIFPQMIKIANAEKIILKNVKKKGIVCYEFELPTFEKINRYELEVYKDSELNDLVFERKMNKNTGCWYSSKSGRFYYRYRVIDEWSRKSEFSPTGEIIFPISPLTEF
ncbi:hypothetical protein M899_3082 [Bacteriovorax sp. BSW11_IV]|nr:hypothetical protein M899_3082 [Bacteriovorax sp. BSW11_IV]